jgi:hypothetical protein
MPAQENIMNTIRSRRALLAGVPVAAAAALAAGTTVSGLAAALATPSSIDPIFAVIAEHREAQEACAVAYEANDLDTDEDPNKLASYNRASAAELPLLTVLPTTVAGVVALLDYVNSPAHRIWQCRRYYDQTILDYARGYTSEAMKDAVAEFDAHVLTALRNISERGQA